MQSAYLLMVDGIANHNKFYRMTQVSNNSFEVRYGRVGAKESPPKIYSMSRWNNIYDAKIKKGYVDESHAHILKKESRFLQIPDPTVRQFFEDIEGYSSRVLQKNYTISYTDVTSTMVRDAEYYLSQISASSDVEAANDLLLKTFHALPRRMKNVSDHMAKRKEDVPKILLKEWELLDVMKARVSKESNGPSDNANQTVLDSLGLEIQPVDDRTESQIKRFMTSESSGKFVRAFRVRNKKTDDRFYDYMNRNGYSEKDIHYLYHGSRNENWYGLLTMGPLLAPQNVVVNGKMFGNGLYFANRAQKSIGYSSLHGSFWAKGNSNKGYLAVYKVLFKAPKYVQKAAKYSLNTISPFDAVFAKKGVDLVNDEIIIYRESQCTLQYIIEIQCK